MKHFVMSQHENATYPDDILVIYPNRDDASSKLSAHTDGNSDLFVCPQGQGGSMVSHMSLDWFSYNVKAM